jgi:hypothetical protein
VIAAYAQLRLARPPATNLRRPWENRPSRTIGHQRASAGGSGTCTRRPALRLMHRNRLSPVPVGHPARRTAAPKGNEAQTRQSGLTRLSSRRISSVYYINPRDY